MTGLITIYDLHNSPVQVHKCVITCVYSLHTVYNITSYKTGVYVYIRYECIFGWTLFLHLWDCFYAGLFEHLWSCLNTGLYLRVYLSRIRAARVVWSMVLDRTGRSSRSRLIIVTSATLQMRVTVNQLKICIDLRLVGVYVQEFESWVN